MNWSLFILVWFFLAAFFLISVSLLFYFRHWASRSTGTTWHNETEGRYYKRYIPSPLRPGYDKQRNSEHSRYHISNRPFWAKLGSTSSLVLIIAVSVFSLIHNMDLFLKTIDIGPSEITELKDIRHHWKREVNATVPDLSTVLQSMGMKNLIVPYGKYDQKRLVNGINLWEYSLQQWQHFADRYGLKIRKCLWNKLLTCNNRNKNVILALPGQWNFDIMNKALAGGARIIAYGPPAQVFDKNTTTDIYWQGLVFERVTKKASGELVLRGDQLLTLGFDAGLSLEIYSPFSGYQAFSRHPQAITVDNFYKKDGYFETRLYAKTTGPGRLVWMEHAPDPADNEPGLNINYLNALTASIFRFLSKQPYSAIATWPRAKPFGALVEEDTEDKYTYAKPVVALFAKHNYPISWYILSNEALKHRQLTREMATTGEIACHGDNHGLFTRNTGREQLIRIARCQKVLREITGVTPRSFRPPEEAFNALTMDAIINNHMSHYIAENDSDRAVPELQISLVNGNSLVSIPRLVSDDYELWHTRHLDYKSTIRQMDEDINWVRYIGGTYMFSFHTQQMVNKKHFNAIKHLAQKLTDSDAYFATSKDVADWWRFRLALIHGETPSVDEFDHFRPVLLTVDEDGTLIKARYPRKTYQ
jgi:peptidoglycan/xylan/chitin deacetylase (PgdA/CDA1 family)